MMPAFGGPLTDQEITLAIEYLRGFCRDLPAWPLGELNLPLPLFTEKAFPENEVVLTSTIALRGSGSVMNEVIYEQRLGARSMFEVGVPFGFVDLTARVERGAKASVATGWTGGLGDLGLRRQTRAFVQSARTGSILAIRLDVSVPTGRARTAVLARASPSSIRSSPTGSCSPRGRSSRRTRARTSPSTLAMRTPNCSGGRRSVGASAWHRFGRMYTPMLEVLGARQVGASDAVGRSGISFLEMQVTLSQRKHVWPARGARIPVNDRTGDRQLQLATYLLWDWYEGSLLAGIGEEHASPPT